MAATLQGFASIGRILKNSNLDPNYRHHLEVLKWELTANLDLTYDEDDRVKLFKILCNQAESGQSDLIRWSAANALQQIEYPNSLKTNLLHTQPTEIEADILQKNISRLSNNDRSYSRDNPCQDREYIKFWVYGPTEILLSVCNGTYYFDVVQEVLRKSGIRGIRLALQGGNTTAITEAVNFAGEIFNQIDPSSTDKRYKDPQTRQKLASLLIPFINHSDIELRNLVAEKLNDGSNGYQVSDYLLDDRNRAKVAVIDTTSSEKWKRVVDLGNLSIPVLCEAIDGKLKFVNNENQNTNSQIEALKSIDKIINNISRKVSILSPYLSHPKDKIKLETFLLLKNHWNYLDEQSIKLLILIALIILDWNSVISFGDRSIPFLCQIVAGKLRLRKDEEININCQIEALKSIDKIINNISRKVSILSPYLLHNKDGINRETFLLLKNHWNYLDEQFIKVLIEMALKIFDDWPLVVSFGEKSIPVLCEIVEDKIILKSDKKSNLNCQIKALKYIDKIITDIPKKVNTLYDYLQHDNDDLRMEVAELLQPHKRYVAHESNYILTALLFDKVNSLQESENLENCLQKAKNEEFRIEETFRKAINACKKSSVLTIEYLDKQKDRLVNQIKEYSNQLQLEINRQKKFKLDKKINLFVTIFNILISITTFSLGLLILQGRSNLFVIPTEFDPNSSYYYIYILLQVGILDIFLGLLFLLLSSFKSLITPPSNSFLFIPTWSYIIIGVLIILALFIIFNLIGIIFTALSSIPVESFGFLLFLFILFILLKFDNELSGCVFSFVFIGILIGIVSTGYIIMGKIFESLSSIPWGILFGISSSFSFFYLTFTILFIIFGFLLLRLESKAYDLQKEIENLENLAKNNLQ
ncbi:MAG: hypothetical protein ACKPHZ_15150 [Dolichospermum sp.]